MEQSGWTKKYTLRGRGYMNHDADLHVANAVEAESFSHVKAGNWNCISKPLPAVFHNPSYILGDNQEYSQQMKFNQPILSHISPTGFQYVLAGNNSSYLNKIHNVLIYMGIEVRCTMLLLIQIYMGICTKCFKLFINNFSCHKLLIKLHVNKAVNNRRISMGVDCRTRD